MLAVAVAAAACFRPLLCAFRFRRHFASGFGLLGPVSLPLSTPLLGLCRDVLRAGYAGTVVGPSDDVTPTRPRNAKPSAIHFRAGEQTAFPLRARVRRCPRSPTDDSSCGHVEQSSALAWGSRRDSYGGCDLAVISLWRQLRCQNPLKPRQIKNDGCRVCPIASAHIITGLASTPVINQS